MPSSNDEWSVTKVTPFATGGAANADWAPPLPKSAKPPPPLQPPPSAARRQTPDRPQSTRWRAAGEKSSFKLMQLPGGGAIVTCEPDPKARNPYTGISLEELEEQPDEVREVLQTFRKSRVPQSILPKQSFVRQDYPVQKLPSPEPDAPTRYFRGNGRQWGGLVSGNFPLHTTQHSRAHNASPPPAEPKDDMRWKTANQMHSHESSAYKADRFTRKNKSLKIALQLKKAYSTGDLDRRKTNTTKLPSFRRCAPGTFNPTFD